MPKPFMRRAAALAVFVLYALSLIGCSSGHAATSSGTWSPKSAARYLDQREAWWMNWPVAQRDHGTFCISCHTVLPYALARPELAQALGGGGLPDGEMKVLADVKTRVRLWNQDKPYYTDQAYGPHKAEQSRGTEAVLNALILAAADAKDGRLSGDTRAAFSEMWATQETAGKGRGAWSWLSFDNEPFEGHDSQYYGAALAAVAVGIAPENYRSSPEIEGNISRLSGYLNREYSHQSAINRVTLLWASTELPGLITEERRESIMKDILGAQRPDGGWSLAALSWNINDWNAKALIKLYARSNASLLGQESDGYATGLIAYTLERAGLASSNEQLKRSLDWLDQNQDPKGGFWRSYSLNNRVDPNSEMGRFMSDAATGFAALALTEGKRQ